MVSDFFLMHFDQEPTKRELEDLIANHESILNEYWSRGARQSRQAYMLNADIKLAKTKLLIGDHR